MVKEWAEQTALRISAAFRHFSQGQLHQASWIPEKYHKEKAKPARTKIHGKTPEAETEAPDTDNDPDPQQEEVVQFMKKGLQAFGNSLLKRPQPY